MTKLRISVKNTSAEGGTALTPFFAGFHDNSFDLYDLGAASSPGLEALAEDGNNDPIAAELVAADADAQAVNVAGARGPIVAGETTSAIVDVDGRSNGYLSLASMVLPSNDAFVGTAEAVQLFDAHGRFLGAQTVSFSGDSVRDAGTEVNTERDAAFINQTAPDTGITENGVVTVHPGFNGSLGNPGGEQIILGGTNAFGEVVDPVAGDFTQPGAQIADIHINTVVEREGTDGRDIIVGRGDDDIVTAGDGNDIVFGRDGWDDIDGGAGRDLLFGGRGDDIIDGGAGRDKIFGGRGDDQILGGDGNDWITGGKGDDAIAGGAGNDDLRGGRGDDTFLFSAGDGHDVIGDFDRRGDDRLALSVEGIDSFEDVLAVANESRKGVTLDFADAGSVFLRRTDIDDLTADDFLFG